VRRWAGWIGIVAAGLGMGLALVWLVGLVVPGANGPYVVRTLPEHGGQASGTASIGITFDRPMDPASVADRVTVSPAITLTGKSEGSTVWLKPGQPLQIAQKYTVSLESGAVAASGGAQMRRSMRWSFSVRSPEAAFESPSTPPYKLWGIQTTPGAEKVGWSDPSLSVLEFAISPDGSQVAFVASNTEGGADLWTQSIVGGHATRQVGCEADQCRHPVWVPNDGGVAFTRQAADGKLAKVAIVNLTTGTVEPLLNDPTLHARNPSWSPDGSKVAFQDLDQGVLQVIDLVSGHAIAYHTFTGLGAAWSPDGRGLIFMVLDVAQEFPALTLYRADVTTGLTTPIEPQGVTLTDFGEPEWSPDGQWIALSARRAGAGPDRGLWVMNPDGSSPQPVAEQAGRAYGGCHWDPWGQALVFQGVDLPPADSPPDVYLWRWSDGQVRLLAKDAFAPAFRP
jgi:Tol biopolymer transport system component